MTRTISLEATLYTKKQLEGLPARPQVILTGRSNVGKSSLINRLAGRQGLAKTSSTPGKTQSVNLYKVDPGDFYLVDLPGYGYARVSKKMRQDFAVLIEAYLAGNPHIRAACALLDCRLEPQASDLDTTAYLAGRGIPVIAVLTKADKCTQRERSARQAQWRDILSGTLPILFSAKTGLGKESLMAALSLAATGESGPDPLS